MGLALSLIIGVVSGDFRLFTFLGLWSIIAVAAGALPVFLGFIVGWYVALRRWTWQEPAIYVATGLHGFLIEIILSGIVLRPLQLLLMGGSAMFIYVSMIEGPRNPRHRRAPRVSLPRAMALWILTLLLMMLGGVVADNLRGLVG